MSLRIVESLGPVSARSAARPGRRKYGVPPGGALDEISLAFANALVGLASDSLGLEVFGRVTVEAEADLTVAAVGAFSTCGRWGLRAGGRAEFMVEPPGACGYIAWSPGWGRSVKIERPEHVSQTTLRVVRGPQFSQAEFSLFCEGSYTVSRVLDRRGVRLEEPLALIHPEITSEPSVVGAVQIPPGGSPIILGPDGPTLGGYPKIAVIIRADLPRLGQLCPGTKVYFERVSVDDARRLVRREWADLAGRLRLMKIGLDLG